MACLGPETSEGPPRADKLWTTAVASQNVSNDSNRPDLPKGVPPDSTHSWRRYDPV